MTDKTNLPAPLSPLVAHNALAAAVTMYQGIIGDYERREQLLQLNQARLLTEMSMLRDELAKLKGDQQSARPPEHPRVAHKEEAQMSAPAPVPSVTTVIDESKRHPRGRV